MESVTFDFPAMLEKLTGIAGWHEEQGPEGDCGLDYWYGAEGHDGEGAVIYEAYINLDQGALTMNVHVLDETGVATGDEGWVAELDLEDLSGTGYEGFVTCTSRPLPGVAPAATLH